MTNKLFVGSLSWNVTDQSLGDFFTQAGQVLSARVITDRNTGRSKGFGFVEMSTEAEAEKAKQELNGKELDGRAIIISEARPQEERPRNNDSRRDHRGGGERRDRW